MDMQSCMKKSYLNELFKVLKWEILIIQKKNIDKNSKNNTKKNDVNYVHAV